jgi:predicted RNA-binding protein with PIN domain
VGEKSLKPFWRGALETTGVLAAFLGFGLAWAALENAGAARPYAPSPMEATTRPAPVWLVDGYNVLCTGLLGGHDRSDWWSEARREELLALLARFDGLDGFDGLGGFDQADAEIWVVFDGAREPSDTGERSGPVRVVFAPSADEWLVEQVRVHAEVAVVTADRKLAGRARHRGARVVSPREFLRRCTGCPPGEERSC